MGRVTASREVAFVRAAVVAVLATAFVARPSRAGEAPGSPRDEGGELVVTEEPLAPEDIRAIRTLLARFAAAMTAGDADGLGELLSPALTPEERRRIVSRARREFERTLYRRFAFELADNPVVERLGSDRVEILALAVYEYETRTEGQSEIAGVGETSYPFRLARVSASRRGGEWRIVWSELIEQFATRSMEQFLGWMFLVVFLVAVAVFFWGWMTMDAYVRFARPGYSVAVLLTPPVGALIYFFAVYLRRSFVRRDEA